MRFLEPSYFVLRAPPPLHLEALVVAARRARARRVRAVRRVDALVLPAPSLLHLDALVVAVWRARARALSPLGAPVECAPSDASTRSCSPLPPSFTSTRSW